MDEFFNATRGELIKKLGTPCIVCGDEAEWDRESYIVHHCKTTNSGWIDECFYDDGETLSSQDMRDLMVALAD